MMNSTVLASLQRLAELISAGALYIVGGAVRDMLQGINPKDYDLTGPYTPKHFVERLEAVGITYWTKHQDYGVIEFEWEGRKFEYTTFMRRVERAHEVRLAQQAIGLSRKQLIEKIEKGEMEPLLPYVEVEFTTDRQLDEQRRDFTCNALYYHIRLQIITNYNLEWVRDAENKILNWIGDADSRSAEDPSRIYRWVRFNVSGYSIGDNGRLPQEVVDKYSKFIPVERFLQEAEKVGPELFPKFWDMLWDMNALDHLGISYTELTPEKEMWVHWMWILYAQLGSAKNAWLTLKLSKDIWHRYDDILLEDCDTLSTSPKLSTLRQLKDKLKVLSLKDLYQFWGVDLPHNIDDPKLDEPPMVTGATLIADGFEPGPGFKDLLQIHLDSQMDR